MPKKQDEVEVYDQPEQITLDALYLENYVPVSNVLNEEEKRLLADGQVPFYIVDCYLDSGKFTSDANPEGYYWVLMIQSGGDIRRLHMTWNERYELQYKAMHKATREENKKVGPCVLRWIEWQGGQPFYKIEAATGVLAKQQEALPF